MLEMIRRIFKIAGRSRQKIIVGITFNILKSFFNGFMMFGVFWILLHLENLTPTIILQAFGVVLGSVIGRFFFQWMYDRTMSGTGYDIFRDYRLEIGEKLKQAPMGYFSEQNLGTIQTILTTTIANLEGYSMLAIEQMTSGVAMAALMSIMMFFFNPIIAILSLIGLLLGLLVLRWVRSRAAQYAPIYQEAQENLVSKTMEYIRGISVLRSFSKGEEGQREVRSAFQKKWDADYGQEKATAGVLRFYILVYKLMSCVLIAAAGLLFMAGKISLPYCLTFLFCAFTVYSDLETMGNSAFLSKKINTELDRLEEVTNIPQMDTSTDKLETSHYDITLDHVSFGYDKRQVIHDISLNIPEHTTCAIVGPSGSGKTTLCNLIARFWDVQDGAVRIGGKDVKNYTADSILEHISMVFQNVYLFHDSIENNIKFGKPDATHEEVEAAAKRACCHDFISALPDGYNTIIGEGGSTLSGGEKQRISIARAILKDAPIIILDEATSSVDPENEQALLSAISELTKNKTLISIAHRLSTVENADQIIVIDQGRIAQQGTHQSLISQEGIYRNFLNLKLASAGWQL
ncbi:ABC transporter ATP-binding protein [[Clostridium] symbiosum]|uniref:ABC transporter ATP-binding protein n=1 Tax=Clostridium symbiosum TaxID=1512 RepID=UPI0001FAC625|nr:ABC transporter ATP-binding protein [[Clostridium] symbiosum]EGB18105.1 ABC transporter, ATP-binding protein [[Clostridium] symbiosum WAL-14673]